MAVLVEQGFNCFIFYLSSIEKCCFLFREVFEKWFVDDCDGLKRFAAYARSACSYSYIYRKHCFFQMVKNTGDTICPQKRTRFIPGTFRIFSKHSGLYISLHVGNFCLQHYNKAKAFQLHQLKTSFVSYYNDIMEHLHAKLQLPASIALSEVNLQHHLNKLTELPGPMYVALSYKPYKLN